VKVGAATVDSGCVSVTLAVPVCPALPVAVIVTALGDGIVVGAVKTPPEVIVPADALHVTVWPETLKVFDAPRATLALAGVTVRGVTKVTLTVFDASVPGLVTENGTVPAVPRYPLAVSCVEETRVVPSAIPPATTRAPCSNPCPLSVTL
jgi:hypothetical protein